MYFLSDAEKYSRLQRLVKLLIEKLLNEPVHDQESKAKHESHAEMVNMVTSEEHDNEHHQHDHLVSAEHNISQVVKPPPSQPV